MSDGPHRSLPLAGPWRTFARRTENSACSPAEVDAALIYALASEVSALPPAVRRALKRSRLFPMSGSILETTPKSPLGILLVEYSCAAGNDGRLDAASGQKILSASLQEHARAQLRAMGEHNLRALPPLDAARLNASQERLISDFNYAAVARDLLMDSLDALSMRVPPKQSGLDEGPGL